MGWHLERRIAKERANGGKAQISAIRADAATGLHIFEERGDQGRIDLLKGQVLWCNAEPLLRKLQ